MDTLCATSRSFSTTFPPLYLEFNVSLIVRCRNHNSTQQTGLGSSGLLLPSHASHSSHFLAEGVHVTNAQFVQLINLNQSPARLTQEC